MSFYFCVAIFVLNNPNLILLLYPHSKACTNTVMTKNRMEIPHPTIDSTLKTIKSLAG